MAGQFTPQDRCEHIYREDRYGRVSAFRSLRHRLRSLKIYIIITVISVGGGAGAVYLPAMLKPPAGDAAQTPLERLRKLKESGNLQDLDPALIEQLKEQYGKGAP